MLTPRVAHRFVKSLLELSVEMGSEEAVYSDALIVNDACNDIRELSVLLQSPVVKSDKKLRIFNEIFKDHLSDLSTRFYSLVIRKKREDLIREIAVTFIKVYKEHKNIHTVHVETASPISDDNRKKVLEYLNKKTTEEIELVEKVNEDLIGGIILRLKDVQIDASVKNSFVKLKREFSKDMYSLKY